MKTRATLILLALFLSFNVGFAQQDEECIINLTLMNDFVKNKKYDEAYEPFMKLRESCPKFHSAIYSYGERILKDKIEKTTGTEQVNFINDLMKLWDEGLANFPDKYTAGGILQDKAMLKYDYKEALGYGNKQVYDTFDELYKKAPESFTNPKGLYIYFSTIVDMYDAKEVEVQDVFNKYDDVIDKIGQEIDNYTQKLNPIIQKEEAGETLDARTAQYKKQYESYLENYDKISGSIDTKLGILANCEVLVPLYKRDFDKYRNDSVWLKRAVNRMFNKECTDDPLYVELVKAYDESSPSADTKYFVYNLLMSQGKEKEARPYLDQSYDLETNPLKKSQLAMRFGKSLRKQGNFGAARNYFQKSLELNPSNGRAHAEIAQMYAASANNCGDDQFSKRAVFWLAAAEARKAGKVDGTIRSYAEKLAASYEGSAPTRSEIFEKGNGGEVIKIGCWIGLSVTVPKI
ncbi:MAG TPA: tetratricopeptide repeat protein [Gelidibacter sp.]|uniref:tetratricopeptide repeat protein n=1 Tax=Gelidibacter sp. TaxID=2018083 RepID=UPI002D1048B8|nr:tetratricopeptide repeat protein [Gelidibacter sp.]HXJ98446.1 tetratricopeptide repeat protein [Gelidibacter sp.]